MNRNWTAASLLAVVAACDEPVDGEATEPGPSTSECLTDADFTRSGTEIAVDTLEFRNAFDPADPTVYDPEQPESLPGPVMVSTTGDRAVGAHSTIGVFPPGFVAPPHVHSDGYYGVVLRGEVTNPFGTDLEAQLDGDPDNNHGDVVLAPGSFWHVPAGSQHSTTCRGPEACWFYFHAASAFDFTPIVDEYGQLAAGITLEAPDVAAVLLPAADRAFAGEEGSFVEFAPGFGDMATGAHGTFGRFEPGAASPLHLHSADYEGVVLDGEMSNPFNGAPASVELEVGGTWTVPADAVHVTLCEGPEACDFYFHASGGFDFAPVCEEQ